MITQQQAEKALELLKDTPRIIATAVIDWKRNSKNEKTYGEWALSRKKLIAEIANNKPTNGDKWRSMTDEQIAEIIAADGCCTCPAIGINSNCGNSELGCKSTIVKWLKQEAKE